MKKNKDKGFTLIEILVTVLIMSILIVIVLPQYKAVKYKVEYTKLETLVTALAASSERYYLSHGSYPSSFDMLDISLPGNPSYSYSDGSIEYRNYGNFPEQGYHLQVANAGAVFATNQHHSFYIGLKFRPGKWGNCKICRASALDKTAQKICEQKAKTTEYETAEAGTAPSAYGLLTRDKMFSYFYQ